MGAAIGPGLPDRLTVAGEVHGADQDQPGGDQDDGAESVDEGQVDADEPTSSTPSCALSFA